MKGHYSSRVVQRETVRLDMQALFVHASHPTARRGEAQAAGEKGAEKKAAGRAGKGERERERERESE